MKKSSVDKLLNSVARFMTCNECYGKVGFRGDFLFCHACGNSFLIELPVTHKIKRGTTKTFCGAEIDDLDHGWKNVNCEKCLKIGKNEL